MQNGLKVARFFKTALSQTRTPTALKKISSLSANEFFSFPSTILLNLVQMLDTKQPFFPPQMLCSPDH